MSESDKNSRATKIRLRNARSKNQKILASALNTSAIEHRFLSDADRQTVLNKSESWDRNSLSSASDEFKLDSLDELRIWLQEKFPISAFRTQCISLIDYQTSPIVEVRADEWDVLLRELLHDFGGFRVFDSIDGKTASVEKDPDDDLFVDYSFWGISTFSDRD